MLGFASSESKSTSAANASVPLVSQHLGTIAINHQNDDIYEITNVRPGGPSRPGVLLLKQYLIHGLTGTMVDASISIPVQLQDCNSPVDPTHAVYARDVNSLVVLIAYDQPALYSIVQLSLPVIQAQMKAKSQPEDPTAIPHRIVQLDLSSSIVWNVTLLPCGPSTNTSGTFPADCMLYASCTTLHNGGDWQLLRTRLKQFARYNTDGVDESSSAEYVVSSTTHRLHGTVFGCGVVDHRPHFLSMIPAAAVFTASQKTLLQAYSQQEAVQLRQQSKRVTTSGTSGGSVAATNHPMHAMNISSSSISSSNSSSTATNQTNEAMNQQCAQSIRKVVDGLLLQYRESNGTGEPEITSDMFALCFGGGVASSILLLTTIKSSLLWLMVDELNRGPHLSHSVTLDDHVTHKMVCCVALVIAVEICGWTKLVFFCLFVF